MPAFYIPLGSPIGGEKVTFEVAQSRVPFTVPIPTYLPGEPTAAYLAEVWVSPPEVTLRAVALVYGSGVTIVVYQDPDPINWSSLVESPFVAINVNGNAGIGNDPGEQDLGGGNMWHYPGNVM